MYLKRFNTNRLITLLLIIQYHQRLIDYQSHSINILISISIMCLFFLKE